MPGPKITRRAVLKASTALALSAAATRVLSAAPPASAITPELVSAAQKEGKVAWYTSIDLAAAERIARRLPRDRRNCAALLQCRARLGSN